jgi:hypothetical protein
VRNERKTPDPVPESAREGHEPALAGAAPSTAGYDAAGEPF